MRLLVTRPQPDADIQAELLRELGHAPVVAPLLDIELEPSAVPPLDDVQAIIVTSRNALRALEARGVADAERAVPVFAVGAATAGLAGDMGFRTVHAGKGTAEQLVPLVTTASDARAGPVLHLAGEQTAWDLKGALEAAGFTIQQPVVYRAVAAKCLPEMVVAAIRAGKIDGVILMSPETAKVFCRLLLAEGLADSVSETVHFCLSAAVASALSPLPASRFEVAASPTQEALLALVGPGAAN